MFKFLLFIFQIYFYHIFCLIMLVIGCIEEEVPLEDQPKVEKQLREVRC